MTNPSNPDTPKERVGSGSLIQRYRRLSLGVKILLFMVLGIVAGILADEAEHCGGQEPHHRAAGQGYAAAARTRPGRVGE